MKFYQANIVFILLFQSFLCMGMDHIDGLELCRPLLLLDAQSIPLKSSQIWETPLSEYAPTPFFIPIPQKLQSYFSASDRVPLPEDSRKKILLLCPDQRAKTKEKILSEIAEIKLAQEICNQIIEVTKEKDKITAENENSRREILQLKEQNKAKEKELARCKEKKKQNEEELKKRIAHCTIATYFIDKKKLPYVTLCKDEEYIKAQSMLFEPLKQAYSKHNLSLTEMLVRDCIQGQAKHTGGYVAKNDFSYFFIRETEQLFIIKINFEQAKELLGIK